MDRRTFIAVAASSAAASQLTLASPIATAAEGAAGSTIPSGKDAALKVITADPLVLETPDELLAAGRVTPTSALFVRNHHGAKAISEMKPRALDGSIEIVGLGPKPLTFSLASLKSIPLTQVEMVLQCSGNFRSQFSKASPIKGTPWNKGGIGNVLVAGHSVGAVLKSLAAEIPKDAKYLTIEAADQPEKDGQIDYEKSVPLDVALGRGLFVTMLNNELLPALHGGPVRFMIPGYYGNVQVKWVTRIRFEARETSNFHQIPDYRTPKQRIAPGEKIEYTFDNSDPNFDMKINSRIFSPAEGSTVRANEAVSLRGVAWNDGTADITAVEVSRDGGKTWIQTELGENAGPFAFRPWATTMQFDKGEHSLWVRAFDSAGRTQPVDGTIFWNPGGYGWNGIEKIRVIAE